MSIHSHNKAVNSQTSHRQHARKTHSPSARRPKIEVLEDRRLLAFDTAVDYAVGEYPLAMLVADFNNDFIQDIAVANYSDHTVSVLIGKADGTFEDEVSSPAGNYPLSLAVGDLNGDDNLDLVTTNYNEINILLGDGTGLFTPSSNSPINIGTYPQSAAVGDFNGDGLLDLGITSNYYHFGYYGCYFYCYYYGQYEGFANVILGDGEGGFSTPKVTSLGYGYHVAAVATNLNGDIYDDFVAINADYSSVAVLSGASDGKLQDPSIHYVGYYPLSVAAGDVNSDGFVDLVTGNYYANSISVLLGDGGGGFGSAKNSPTGGYVRSVALGDFTGDGYVDVAVANNYPDSVKVLYGENNGNFSPPLNFDVDLSPIGLAAGDFNGDTRPDLAVAKNVGNKVSVLTNDQDWPPAPLSLTIDDVMVTEGNSGTTVASFTVSLSAVSEEDVTVHFETFAGSAAAGSDYTGVLSGDVTIPAGSLSQSIPILVIGDTRDEYVETFYVNLSNAVGAVITDSSGTGTIDDDDEAPTVSINDVSLKEGFPKNTTFIFTVSLSEASDKGIYVYFATEDGTAKEADGDYYSTSGYVYFAPGQTTRTISVAVLGDKTKEDDETFAVNLTGADNATISDDQGIATILNDDNGKGKGGGKGKPT